MESILSDPNQLENISNDHLGKFINDIMYILFKGQ